MSQAQSPQHQSLHFLNSWCKKTAALWQNNGLFLVLQLLHRSARVICERDTKSHARHIPSSVPAHAQRLTKYSHNTGNFMLCSFRIVCGFFNVPQWTYINMDGICETGPTVYHPYPRRLESLTICWFHYKGSTFYSVILRPWVLVRPESNSWPPAWQPDVPPSSHQYAACPSSPTKIAINLQAAHLLEWLGSSSNKWTLERY